MGKVNFSKFLTVVILAMGILVMGSDAVADSLTVPVRIATSTASDGPTLGIPRWKAYMSEIDPNQFWACYANGSRTLSNISYTTDGGKTWSTTAIQIEPTGYLDMHCSVFGRNGNLYTTWPGRNSITFRKFSAPIHNNTDGGSLVSISGTTAYNRSNIMVQPTGRVWLFTRPGTTGTAENVLYNYSDNEGLSWTRGTVYATNFNSVRIGSMPYAGGNPAVIVLYLGDSRGFEYYHWNGSSFVARPDHSIYPVNMGQTRAFTHNVINDTIFHLVFGLGNELHHVWKNYNNGSGIWNHQIIDNSSTTTGNEWYPTSTVRGNELYLFYTKKSTTASTSSMVYYQKWSQETQTWTNPTLISSNTANASNRDPNTCFNVPVSSSYVPVIWRSGTGPFDINFSRVIVNPDTVVSPPQFVLNITGNPEIGGIVEPPAGSIYYDEGTEVNLMAVAASGYVFDSWTGDVVDPTSPSTSIIMNSDKTVTANFTVVSETPTGSIYGAVRSGEGGLEGIYINLSNTDGEFIMCAITDTNGSYLMSELPPGDYVVDLDLPLGFDPIGSPSVPVTVADTGIQIDFALSNIASESPLDYWWWKRQITAIQAGASANFTRADIETYCGLIFEHFCSRNDEYAICIDGASCMDGGVRALTFDDIVDSWIDNLDESTSGRTKRHLLTCLLNVVSDRLSQRAVVSADGATASQAITYLAGRFIDGAIADGTIWYNFSRINAGVMIAAGVIPLSTPDITYRPEGNNGNSLTPGNFTLSQNYPNPFNSSTVIKYDVPDPARVRIEIFNVLSQAVRTLMDEKKAAGSYQLIWNGTDDAGAAVGSGVYFYRITSDNFTQSKKMVLMK